MLGQGRAQASPSSRRAKSRATPRTSCRFLAGRRDETSIHTHIHTYAQFFKSPTPVTCMGFFFLDCGMTNSCLTLCLWCLERSRQDERHHHTRNTRERRLASGKIVPRRAWQYTVHEPVVSKMEFSAVSTSSITKEIRFLENLEKIHS